MRPVRARADGGFTLIELLVAISIIGVILVPLTNVVIDYLLNSTSASARLSASHDAQIAAAYWQQDVSSLGVQSYDSASGKFVYQTSVNNSTIGDCSVPAGATKLISLDWYSYPDASGNPTQVVVTYVTESSGSELVRMQCSGGSLVSSATLTHQLNAAPTCTFDGTASACASYTGSPSTIGLTLSISDPSGNGQPYTVTIVGQRRQT